MATVLAAAVPVASVADCRGADTTRHQAARAHGHAACWYWPFIWRRLVPARVWLPGVDGRTRGWGAWWSTGSAARGATWGGARGGSAVTVEDETLPLGMAVSSVLRGQSVLLSTRSGIWGVA